MQLAYGHEHIELALPEQVKVISGRGAEALLDPVTAVQAALRAPIGSPALSSLLGSDHKVVVLISDSTRPTGADLFLPILLQELELCGVKDENITLMVATGAHGVLHDQELDALVSPETRQRYRLLAHDCFDQSGLVMVGTTSRGNDVWLNRIAVEADLRILTGAVSVHPFAGFGGGRKALFPGVAGYESICRNHALMMHPKAKPGILAGNPVHEDLMEGVAMAGPLFLLNSVINEAGEMAAIFGGDVEQAHAAGVRAVLDSAVATVPTAYDTVIASAGGFPYDINLYQAVKAMQNADRIVKEGGQIVLFAQCEQGIGSAKFEEWGKQRLSSQQLGEQLARQFILGKHKCYFVSEILEQADIYLCSSLPDELVCELGLKPFHSLDEIGLQGDVVVMPRATATLPQIEE
ncbi:MAG: nickel-dependent lactate racemase [Bacillota bacterium]